MRGAWCDLKGGASGPLAIVWPAQFRTTAAFGRRLGLKGGASGSLAIMCTRPALELQWRSGARMGVGCRVQGAGHGGQE